MSELRSGDAAENCLLWGGIPLLIPRSGRSASLEQLKGALALCSCRDFRCWMQEYVDLLIGEISASAQVGGAPLRTVYFGGGTPSLIPPQQLERLIKAIDRRFGVASGAEVSMEADPGTFDAQRLKQYMALGLTRFSIGVQAFQEVSLCPVFWLKTQAYLKAAACPCCSACLQVFVHHVKALATYPPHSQHLSCLATLCSGRAAACLSCIWPPSL